MIAIEQYSACIKAPFATLGIISDETHLLAIHFLPVSIDAKPPTPNTIAHLAAVQLMIYLDKPSFKFDLPIKLNGSKHQLDVWHAMQKIPAGKTKTYGELALSIDSSPRAIGTAGKIRCRLWCRVIALRQQMAWADSWAASVMIHSRSNAGC
jgi:methylated-DNA-[protein]-cysteine S-methyltransferase